MPTRNAAEWIGACLSGIESNRPAQIIVVDGGSDDGTRDIALAHADIVLDDEGAGVSAARQLGVEATTEAWVALVDADVVIGPNALASLLDEASERGLSGLQAGLFSTGCDDYWSQQLARHHNRGQVRDWFGVSATIVRREVLLSHPFDPALRSGEDIDLRLRLRAAKVPVGVSRRTSVIHRFGGGFEFCRDQWLADGAGLGRMVRSHGLRSVPKAMLPFPAAALGMLDALSDWLRPLPYFAGFAVGNWIGLSRGLRDTRVPVRTPARRAVCFAMLVFIASLVVLGPLAIASAAAGSAALAAAAYDGADWALGVSVAGLCALIVIVLDFAGPSATGPRMRLLAPLIWALGIAGMICAAGSLAGVIYS